MADKTYEYSKAADFGGAFNSDRFRLQVDGSEITRKLRGINTIGDAVYVVFKGAGDLTTPELDELQGASYPAPIGGLIAAHSGLPVDQDPQLVRQVFHVDNHRAQVDGHILECAASEWGYDDYVIPHDLHLNESLVFFDGFKPGDYAFPVVINPAGDTDLSDGESQGETVIRLGSGKAVWYQPAYGAQHLELWNAAMDTLLECHAIVSADPSPDTVTIATGLVAARDNTVKARVRYGSFCPVRGAEGISGGLYAIGQDRFSLRQPYSMTNLLPAGTVISARMKTTAEVGDRKLACTYIFRTP